MINKIEGEFNLKDMTSASVEIPSANSVNIFAEGESLKQKNSSGDISQLVWSDPGASGGSVIPNIIEVTQAQYDALTPDAGTLYIING